MFELINNNCETILPQLIDNGIKVDLIIFDPPYFSTNISVLGDNNWRNLDEYIEWFRNILNLFDEILTDNGSLYIFHNDFSIMVDLLYYLKHNLSFRLRNNIKIDKRNLNKFTTAIKSYGSYRNFLTAFSEDLYFITKQQDYIKSPFSNILLDALSKHKRKDITKLIPSKNGKITNWIQNHLTGRAIPTREQWEIITKYLNISNEYDELLTQYKNSRYSFNQPFIDFKGMDTDTQKIHLHKFSEIQLFEHTKYDNVSDFKYNKPYDLIKRIIEISSNDNDLVLDCTMGSGTTGLVCKNLNRQFIGIENNLETFKIAQKRIYI
jgi:DNA modification methylase